MPTHAAITLEQANKILDVVIEAGFLEPPKPYTGAEIVDTAANVVKSAANAKRLGNTNKYVQQVLDLASPLQNVPAFDDIDLTKQKNVDKFTNDRASTAIPNGDINRFDDESPATGNNLSREDTAAKSTDSTLLQPDREKESSHYLDTNVKIEIPDLPRDFSKVGDLELRTLHAERHGILSKVIFELGLETSDYESAQVSYDETYKFAIINEDSDKITDKRDKAFTNDEVVEWRSKVDEHHKKVIMLRAYRELLESEIRGLSREFTMRTGERNTTP